MTIHARKTAPGLLGVFLVFAWTASAFGEEPANAVAGKATDNAAGIEFFEQSIRPVLAEHCYKCHSAESDPVKGGLRLDDRQSIRAGGESGPAVVPGKVDASLLMQAIEYEGEFYDMPPDGKLPAKAIADIRRWIAMGAPDPRKSKGESPAATSANSAASREDLWVLRPLRRPVVPEVSDVSPAAGTVDRFILATLDRQGLKPAAAADRYTLLRRITFDLTGLPPTPKEIEAFVADGSEAAWERVVDRLLASPAFGDHWARHWFDLSCYADLADVQGNVVVQGAWRYRDYVIAALNADKPIDRFIAEQIAGDLLPYDTPAQRREQLIATGYLSIGPWALQNYVKQQLAADVVDHQVDKIGRTFLGMSVRCARCHDHKFDPIPTADYYALAGIFHSTLTTRYDGPGVWSQVVSRELPAVPGDRALAELKRTKEQIQAEQASLTAEIRRLESNETPHKFTEKVASTTANALTLAEPIAANEAGREYRVAFVAGPSVWNGPTQATAAEDSLMIQVLRPDDSVLANFEHRPGVWAGTAESQKLSPGSFTYRGDGAGGVRIHITAGRLHSGRFAGAIDDVTVAELTSAKLTAAAAGDVKVLFSEDFESYRPGGAAGQQADTKLPVYAAGTIPRWNGGGLNHSHAVDHSGKSDERNIALQIFSGPAGTSMDPHVAKLQQALGDLAASLRLLDYARPNWTHVLAVQDVAEPHDAPIYARGNFRAVGKVVPRGALSAYSEEPFPAIAPGTSGRKELAEWLTSSGNSVTPRVLANRVWQHLFGAGIVRSVDYFGIHGDRPSHPELLDYLAIRLRDDAHWSLKTLIRELVLSDAYRMSSEHNAQAAAVDPDNRLLWHANRRRLTAESIRDGMLATSGTLDEGRGGDALGLEIPGNVGGIGDQVNLPTYSRAKIPDHIVHRRSVYLPLLRSPPDGPLEILSVFDFPHPSEITGQRAERTVATQALFLINAPFVRQQSEQTAKRVFATHSDGDESGGDAARVNQLYLLVLNRTAQPQEVRDAIDFVAQYAEARGALPDAPADLRLAAWAEFCRALYASNDFLFME
ncbi:MAG: PSD1 and planctomycete cytochrome C domain-containing protein [Pirellulales bacterium]